MWRERERGTSDYYAPVARICFYFLPTTAIKSTRFSGEKKNEKCPKIAREKKRITISGYTYSELVYYIVWPVTS